MDLKMINQDIDKMKQFDGSNFIWWKDKMKFLLMELVMFYVLEQSLLPQPTSKDSDEIKSMHNCKTVFLSIDLGFTRT